MKNILKMPIMAAAAILTLSCDKVESEFGHENVGFARSEMSVVVNLYDEHKEDDELVLDQMTLYRSGIRRKYSEVSARVIVEDGRDSSGQVIPSSLVKSVSPVIIPEGEREGIVKVTMDRQKMKELDEFKIWHLVFRIVEPADMLSERTCRCRINISFE